MSRNLGIVNVTLYVEGFEWGPGVPKLIAEFSEEVTAVHPEKARAITKDTIRTVTDLYLSDARANRTDGPSKYVTVTMETDSKASGSPFTYDTEVTFMNDWSKEYPVDLCLSVDDLGGEKTEVSAKGNYIDSRICPETEAFDVRGEYSGNDTNPMTKQRETLTLRYAAYEPSELKKDGKKNPLIIWLHGQGEGGTDPDIVLLGNEVVNLAHEEIQSQFTTQGGANGAYVLTVQSPTYWMDGGDGTNSFGDLVSRYSRILKDTIDHYIASNPDIDTRRIYLGGCSNGGYMTINMLIRYPWFWAAAYPCCEAYSYHIFERNADGSYRAEGEGWAKKRFMAEELWMTPEKVDILKTMPIWFIQSANDFTVRPEEFAKPTYRALLQAGAKNHWFSMFESVKGTDDPKGEYIGHLSWIYIFKNQVTGVQDPEKIRESTDEEAMGFEPTDQGGGMCRARDENGTYDNLFAWMNAQHLD